MSARTVLVDGVAKRRIDLVRVGDRLDLEGDYYADPTNQEPTNYTDHPEWGFEFERVRFIGGVSPKEIRLDFESGFCCWFPRDHLVDVDGEQDDRLPFIEREPGRYYVRDDVEAGWLDAETMAEEHGSDWRDYVGPE